MTKNPFGKSRTKEAPYAIFQGFGPFGQTEHRILKTYQTVEAEKKNQYARWFVAVKSDFTYGGYDMGDSYVNDVLYSRPRLVQCTKDWAEAYPDLVDNETEIV